MNHSRRSSPWSTLPAVPRWDAHPARTRKSSSLNCTSVKHLWLNSRIQFCTMDSSSEPENVIICLLKQCEDLLVQQDQQSKILDCGHRHSETYWMIYLPIYGVWRSVCLEQQMRNFLLLSEHGTQHLKLWNGYYNGSFQMCMFNSNWWHMTWFNSNWWHMTWFNSNWWHMTWFNSNWWHMTWFNSCS